MQNEHSSSKGKGRAMEREADYAQPLASPSLSDCGDPIASQSNPSSPSYTGAYGVDNSYRFTEQSSISIAQFFPTACRVDASYSNTYSYSALSPAGSTGYEDRDEPAGTPNYSDHTEDDAESIISKCASSSEAGSERGSLEGSISGSSDMSAQSRHTDLNNTTRQRRPNEGYRLFCEFHNLTGCNRIYPSDDTQGWMDHHEEHLESKFPRRLTCWFCTDQRFDALEMYGGDVRSNFNARMGHIRDHLIHDGYRPEQMWKDGHLVKHLLDNRLIDKHTYQSIVNPNPASLPPIPTTAKGDVRSYSHRAHRSRRHLPKVDEEMVAGPSSRHHHSHRHQVPETRPAGHQHISKRARRSRENRGEFIIKSAVVSTDDIAPEASAKPPNSLYFPRKNLENSLLEGPRTSEGDDASCEAQGTGHMREKIVENIAVNELHRVDNESAREVTNCSIKRIDLTQLQDHSNNGSSSGRSRTSSPDSVSFWLTEYPENEDKGLEEDHPFMRIRPLAVARVFEAFRSWKGNHVEQDNPRDGAEESTHVPDQDKGKGKEPATGKRTRVDRSELNRSNIDSRDPSSSRSRVGRNKRRRTSERQLTFACPYTKKDSMSYRDCYKYTLSRIRDVKQHLARCHRNPPYCPRCMRTFQTEEGRDEHIRDFPCPLRQSITLDGITEFQGRQLSKKSAPNTSPESQWFVVFDIVFPGHKPRPQSPYVDRELLQDITHYQDFLTNHGPRILSEVLEERGFVIWHYLCNGQRDVAAFQQTVLVEGLSTIFDQWLARRSNSSSQDFDGASSSGSNNRGTPQSSSYSRERASSTSAHHSAAVHPEVEGSLPGGEPVGAPRTAEDVPGASAGEIYGGSLNFEDGDFELLTGIIYDDSGEDLRPLTMDDA